MNERNRMILKLRAQRLSYSQIGEALGISRQRVHQILKNYVSGDDVPRGEYKCIMCGKMSDLECHHIDFDCYNHEAKNLEWLCKRCHAKKHRGRGKEPYLGERLRARKSSMKRQQKTKF